MKRTSEVNDSFFKRVYQVVRSIPYGRVSTYGAIASYLGSKGSARMVGWAMNSSHRELPAVPAHRVVNRTGMLSGKHHFESNSLMQKLLENEGLTIVNDEILNFKSAFWDPSIELDEQLK
ncbi:MAG TPA: MGMT family protein [Bacteroidia bacterium]|nr:MGMT family protein [Bacteroidia bacterium]HNT80360.1 MGMT family protein [Bacteroidia bacterium]